MQLINPNALICKHAIFQIEINFSLKGIIPSLMQTICPDFQTLENFAVTTLYIVLSLLTGLHPAWPRGT